MKKWKIKKDNNLRGAYGETDYNKKVIRINKKAHKKDKASLIDTLVHEMLHKNHPNMLERTVRKITPKKIKKMAAKVKNKLYKKLK